MDTQKLRELDAALRTNFHTFYVRCFMHLNPAADFKDGLCIAGMANFANQVINGDIRRGIVNMPPRQGKSLLFNVAMSAFILGNNPGARIFSISYAGPLSNEHATLFRMIVESGWYRRVFPRMKIRRSADDDVYTTKGGYRKSTSVLGSMTGMGGDYFIIDDPIKPIDCESQPRRDAVNQWFTNTLLSRLDDKEKGRILVIMQRLHPEDLSGYLLRGFEGWEHLCLPAIADLPQDIELGHGRVYHRKIGEVLHPERESLATIEAQRQEMGERIFAAHCQQRPASAEASMISPRHIRIYDKLPDRDAQSYVLISVDSAAKQGLLNSYTACTTWLVQKENRYLVHVLRKRLSFPNLCETVGTLVKKFKADYLLIEDASSGTQLLQTLGSRCGSARVKGVKPERNKELRMFVQVDKFEKGQVLIPREEQPWTRIFLEEVYNFPDVSRTDQVDSMSQALAFKKPFGFSKESLEGLARLNSGLCGGFGGMPMIV